MTAAAPAERWAPIPGVAGYEASDLGRIRSINRTIATSHGVTRRLPGKVLSPSSLPGGHRFFHPTKTVNYYVHVAVLEAFIGPCPDGLECLHWDDDPSNNRLVNLRWGTRSENLRDRVRNGRHHANNREHCPRQHALVAPNLVPSESKRRGGGRSCLACSRAISQRAWMRTKGVEIDLQAVSDAYYAELMSAAAA